MDKLIISILVIALIVGSFFVGNYYNGITNQPTKVKLQVGNQCIEGVMSIEEWYFQQKLWAKLNMPEQMTQICN